MSSEGISLELRGWGLRLVLLQGISIFSGKFCFSSLRCQDSWPCSCAPYVVSTSLVVYSFRGSWSYRTHPSNFLEKAGQNQGKVSKSTNHRNQGIANNNCTQLGATRDARFTGVIHPERITHHVHWFFLHCFELTFSPASPFQNPCSFPSLGWINIVAKF